MHVQIWENWYLRTDIYPQAAPIIAHLPLGYAQGFSVVVQVLPISRTTLLRPGHDH